ncbi:hypothetical protein AURDEDRAFT_165968 [Auricularia subglabra TFB-10046 SS5]|nr:hypothetical protein AURDEDRAFT_165968 [Auricularia subglabra TFB-10046 SS5]
MPADPDRPIPADREHSLYDKESPDLVGEELGDNARIWRIYDRVAREEDQERVANWNRGLDNLALFAGLFSAVTTAFIIELRADTEPDYARLTFLVLNASAAGISFKEDPFVIDGSVRTINCLWIASLMLSLTAALIAIMGKDWIEVRSQPTPAFLAHSLSLLDGMSQAPEILQAILVSLGDLAVGSSVSPFLSPNLRARITAEIRHNWAKASLITRSRYVLADHYHVIMHLEDRSEVVAQFERLVQDPSFRSENVLFALVKLFNGAYVEYNTIQNSFPDVPIQPRAVQYLLARSSFSSPWPFLPLAIMLVHRYWQHLKDNPSFDLQSELLRVMDSQARERYSKVVERRFEGSTGLVELLVYLLDELCPSYLWDRLEEPILDLIAKILVQRSGHWNTRALTPLDSRRD